MYMSTADLPAGLAYTVAKVALGTMARTAAAVLPVSTRSSMSKNPSPSPSKPLSNLSWPC